MKKKYIVTDGHVYFSQSVVIGFKHNNKHLRYGQAFHQYAGLEQVDGNAKNFCDRLYEADGEKAKAMIISRTLFDYS